MLQINHSFKKQINFNFRFLVFFTLGLTLFGLPQEGKGQQAIFNGYQHNELRGNHFKIHTVGRIENADHNGFINDDIKSMQIKPGYKATIYDHYDGKGYSHQLVGKTSESYWLVTKKEDGRNFHWIDAVSSVKVEKLPSDYRDKQIEAGLYYIFNPNLMGYLRGGNNNSGQLTLFNNDWQWHKNKKPYFERNIIKEEFGFIVIPIGHNTYNIVNAATNQLLVYETASSGEDNKPRIILKNFDPENINEEAAKFTIKHLGIGRFTIAPRIDGNNLLTSDFDPGRREGAQTNLKYNTQNFNQQFEFISWEGISFSDIDIKEVSEDHEPEISSVKNGKSPYFAEKTITVPFYLIKDDEYHHDIMRQMNESPYYTITTRKFLVNLEDDDGKSMINKTGIEQERSWEKSVVKTNASTFEINHNYSLMVGNEWEVGSVFAKSKFKVELTASVGFTHSKSNSESLGNTELIKQRVAPCTEGFMKGSGLEIIIKNKRGQVVSSYSQVDSELNAYHSIPFHPINDRCDLSESQIEDALFKYNKYYGTSSDNEDTASSSNEEDTDSSDNNSSTDNSSLGSFWSMFQNQKAVDIASNSNGDIYIAGTNRSEPGGYDVLHWRDGKFQRIFGQVAALDVGDNRILWGVNEGGQVYKRISDNYWILFGKHTAAKDIGVGPNGEVWIIGGNTYTGGYGIHQLDGENFVEVGGAAVRISVDQSGMPWIINDSGAVFKRENNNWTYIEGVIGKDISNGNGAVWVTDKQDNIYKYTPNLSSKWTKTDGLASSISVGQDGMPIVVNSEGNIFERK